MSRRLAGIIIATVLAGLLFASVTTSGGVRFWIEPDLEAVPSEPTPIEIDQRPDEPIAPLPEPNEGSPLVLPEWIQAVLRVVLVAAALAAAIALAMTAWQKRPRLRWRRRPHRDADFDVLPDVAAAVVDEAAAQRAALRTGAPRNAIVRCWLRLEHDVAAVGLARHAADTSVEFTERVLGRYTLDPEAIRELAALYREARFSTHPLDETARDAAMAALDRLHHALGEHAEREADKADKADEVVGATR